MTLQLRGPGLQLATEPEAGARITGLRADDGHEWLLQPDDDWAGGWDEVAPSISPVTLADGSEVPDHGDALRMPWRVERASPDEIELSVQLVSVPVRLRRRAVPTARGIRLDYTATTSHASPVPFLWAAHPQFDGAGARIRLPSALPVIEEHPEAGRALTLPDDPFDGIAPGSSLKVFATTVVESVTVERSGRRLTLSWSAGELPWLGLFWDAGEFARRPVIAIEPSTGFGDSLLAAAASERVLSVSRERPLRWSLELVAH